MKGRLLRSIIPASVSQSVSLFFPGTQHESAMLVLCKHGCSSAPVGCQLSDQAFGAPKDSALWEQLTGSPPCLRWRLFWTEVRCIRRGSCHDSHGQGRRFDAACARGVMVSDVGLINEVNQRRARWVLGWVTVYRQINHLGMYVTNQLGQFSLPPCVKW